VVTICVEQPSDAPAIAAINRSAFGQESEAWLVERIREAPGFDPRLSLVAWRDGQPVGHILFSPVRVETTAGPVPALALAPMAVRPEWQNQGIGTRLVQEGFEACRRLGHRLVIVLGHPKYYPRFGFVPAGAKGLICPFDAPEVAFMVLELVPGALNGVQGTVRYPPPFDEV